jgi:hypothetical protein
MQLRGNGATPQPWSLAADTSQVCKTRTDAVEKALEEALVRAGLDTGARTGKGRCKAAL